MNSKALRYSTGTKILHWLIAIIVIAMLAVSFFLGDLPKQYKPTAFFVHKSFGLTVLFLMIIRLLWVSLTGKPNLPITVSFWQKALARSVQFSLYLFLFAMPLSGWIMAVSANKAPSFFGLFHANLPIEPNKTLAHLMNDLHTVFAWTLIALILLHIAGGLKHYLIDKDRVLQSMLPERKP